ncbi:MAG TPA: PDZ domain-containing protein, partial [Patescibacteria group bacterium]|nr:PDZ domain-containing protein [Patescibacteria group bacterium]
VAVIKIDKVSGLPTLAFADPAALVQGQVIVSVGGPFDGGTVTPAYVSAMHRVVAYTDPAGGGRTATFSDAIVTNAAVDAGTSGGPMLNVEAQVVGIAMQSPARSSGGFGLNAADVQDVVQQILQTGQLIVPSLGTSSVQITADQASLLGIPEGSQVLTVDKTGPAGSIGLLPGDVITQLDDLKVDESHPLELLLRSRFHPNQRVTVTYSRAGTSTQAELTLVGEHPTCS